MSYVIHNFSPYAYTLRMNWKVRSLQLIRNYITLYTFFNSRPLFALYATSTWVFPIVLFHNNYTYFNRLYEILFPKIYEIKHSPIGVNFPRSAHLKTLLSLDILFCTGQVNPVTLIPFRSLRSYPYAFGTALAITATAKSFYSTILYRFLRMSLLLWFNFASTYKFWVHYTLMTSRFQLLPFTNKYYFKVYHV